VGIKSVGHRLSKLWNASDSLSDSCSNSFADAFSDSFADSRSCDIIADDKGSYDIHANHGRTDHEFTHDWLSCDASTGRSHTCSCDHDSCSRDSCSRDACSRDACSRDACSCDSCSNHARPGDACPCDARSRDGGTYDRLANDRRARDCEPNCRCVGGREHGDDHFGFPAPI